MINLEKVGKNYTVLFNKKEIGSFILDVDGSYYFWTDDCGAWSSYSLELVAEELDRINKPFDDLIKQMEAEVHNNRNNLNK